MKKKFFTVALATTMALSTAISASAESISGTAWWDAANETSQDYGLSGDASLTLSIVPTGDAPEFCVELWQGSETGYYLTTTSAGDAWFFTATGDVTKDANYSVTSGDTIEVTVKRSGNTFTVSYYDATTGTAVCPDMVGVSNEDWGDTIKVHVLAQVGDLEITQKTDSPDNNTTTASNDNTTATTAGSTNLTTTKATTAAKTGDVAPVAALATVAVVACAAVVVSKKRVTD